MKVRSSYSRKNVQADYNLSHFEILLSNRSLYYFGPLSPSSYNMKNLKIKVLALLRKHMINKTLPQINR